MHTEPTSSLLATDFYQLAMLHAYRQAGMGQKAVFEFFVRRLPRTRGFLVAAGLASLIEYLEAARFTSQELEWLRQSGRFPADFIDSLADWRFTGDVDAILEGTPIFANEPLVRVSAPIGQAQLVETAAISLLHYQTLIATKAARMALAAPGKSLVDFGLRRAHSLEAGLYAARAAYLAGFAGTATTLAGERFGIPVHGTMAHSFVQAHDVETEAFLDFARARPAETTLLIDTYDTEAAARSIVGLKAAFAGMGADIHAVRIDSGDLAEEARAVRRILDAGGLTDVRIMASGGLDEWSLRELVASEAPIDSFGIGTSLVTSEDVPALDCAYKLVEYAGVPRRKRSHGKVLWPGAKQVFRRRDNQGSPLGDVISLADEAIDGEPLLRPVMRGGKRLDAPTLEQSRDFARREIARLPSAVRDLDAPSMYPVEIGPVLNALAASMDREGR